MRISVLGAGYVGLCTAAVFAEKGHEAICADIDDNKISLINKKIPPIAEEGLSELLENHVGKRLFATTDVGASISSTEMTFVCVQTPSRRDGSFDLSFLKRACRDIGDALRNKDYHVVVLKSTVPPTTTENLVLPTLERVTKKKCGKDFGLSFSPEFLREGHAVHDAMHPSRIVIGSCDVESRKVLLGLYSTFECKKITCSPATAEMIKLASNAFLATKISFMNEIGVICKKMGVNVYEVREGMIADPRISPAHLDAGLGFGGSCFPKDVRGLIAFSRKHSHNPSLLESVMRINERQVNRFCSMVRAKKGEKIGILGLAFKKGTDDVRDSQALKVVDFLLKKRARLFVYDPKASANARRIYGERLRYCRGASEVLAECKKILILTDWEEFFHLDFSGKVVFDGRHVVGKGEGFEYHGLSW